MISSQAVGQELGLTISMCVPFLYIPIIEQYASLATCANNHSRRTGEFSLVIHGSGVPREVAPTSSSPTRSNRYSAYISRGTESRILFRGCVGKNVAMEIGLLVDQPLGACRFGVEHLDIDLQRIEGYYLWVLLSSMFGTSYGPRERRTEATVLCDQIKVC